MNGYTDGTDSPRSALLKNASEIEKPSSISRSRCHSVGRRRQGMNGSRKKAHSGSQT